MAGGTLGKSGSGVWARGGRTSAPLSGRDHVGQERREVPDPKGCCRKQGFREGPTATAMWPHDRARAVGEAGPARPGLRLTAFPGTPLFRAGFDDPFRAASTSREAVALRYATSVPTGPLFRQPKLGRYRGESAAAAVPAAARRDRWPCRTCPGASWIRVGIVVRPVVDPAEEAPFRRLLTSPAGNGDPVRLRCCCRRTAVEVNASPATLTATGVLPRSSAPTTSRANASYPRSRTAAVLASPAAHRHATHWAAG
ncbi:hypothetical protein IscW_ISCW000629 [Ixodes scapularis]|uniref:Uncharacterized protein n=1 Tax=Ixodes scapularis TaxID=6945 RepID=B7P7D7_IXOSC|nr:hypothetical protein IscW_ISCW000629 [Ixodes scapularis]|eukprot:XP_002410048.1 hypothetical protein IscW_ISCW000629 [Ixodes scapularis]